MASHNGDQPRLCRCKKSKDELPRDKEAERILQIYGEKVPDMMAMLERQFAVLHNRAQVMLGFCGIVITTTGFSGRLIAGTNLSAQVAVIIGLLFVLAAACTVVWGVLHLRWLTLQPGETPADWLWTSLRYRDLKTCHYRNSIYLMLAGLTFYVFAISVMLLFPTSNVATMNR